MGLIGHIRAYYGGLLGILSRLTKSTDHPSRAYYGLPGPFEKGDIAPYWGYPWRWRGWAQVLGRSADLAASKSDSKNGS